jgi:hypothetical protein
MKKVIFTTLFLVITVLAFTNFYNYKFNPGKAYTNPVKVKVIDGYKLVNYKIHNFEYKPAPIFNNAPSRALNTTFQPLANRATHGTYSIAIATTLSLANLNSAGSIFLEISPDGTTWTTIQSAGTAQTLTVSLSLGLNTTTTYNVTGWIPLNWYCRLRTVTSGGATATLANGQEVMF